jgi:rRNA maturation endonuclease Nob1
MKTEINKVGNLSPEAKLTVNKNRVKVYEGNTYYLKDGQTFEIELYNPTTHKVKAVIHLDGDNISAGGLVLNPGQRIYLERFVDTNNKFVFKTYEVDDSDEVREAIKYNGSLSIEFYRTQHQQPIGWYPTVTQGYYYDYYNQHNTISATTTNTFNISNTSCSVTSTETGRTEKGGESNQEFTTSFDTFEQYPFSKMSYGIKPESTKPITKDDLIHKRYCTECGSKVKPSFKFCPRCGEKQ